MAWLVFRHVKTIIFHASYACRNCQPPYGIPSSATESEWLVYTELYYKSIIIIYLFQTSIRDQYHAPLAII